MPNESQLHLTCQAIDYMHEVKGIQNQVRGVPKRQLFSNNLLQQGARLLKTETDLTQQDLDNFLERIKAFFRDEVIFGKCLSVLNYELKIITAINVHHLHFDDLEKWLMLALITGHYDEVVFKNNPNRVTPEMRFCVASLFAIEVFSARLVNFLNSAGKNQDGLNKLELMCLMDNLSTLKSQDLFGWRFTVDDYLKEAAPEFDMSTCDQHIYYPYSKEKNRYHLFKVAYHGLHGDAAKHYILLEFKRYLSAKRNSTSLSSVIEACAKTEEYKILATPQGFVTWLFRLKPSSLTSFDKICEEVQIQVDRMVKR